MKTKICSFAINFIHACIMANNFIKENLNDVKIIYINEENEKQKIKDVITKYYPEVEHVSFYNDILDEKIINEYDSEKFVYVVYGSEKFIEKVNKYLDINKFSGYIINNYKVITLKEDMNDIINKHKYYINTTYIYVSKDYSLKKK
ncbi:MAG: hypothetical protein RSB51_01295 [Clostridia bacterium]